MGSRVILTVIAIIFAEINDMNSTKYELTIGVILDAKDVITTKITSLAVQMANNELSNFNYTLQMKIERIDENKSFNSIEKACNLLQSGLVAILSPIDAVPSRHISSFCSKFHIPHLVTSCRFPESLETYPMDVRMAPDCNQYANIIHQYITKIENWRSMVIIHSSDNCILKFESLFNQFKFQLRMRRWVHQDLKKNKALMRELSKSKTQSNFLVDIPYWQIKEFLIMASVYDMTKSQYTFIFTDWDASLVDIAAFKINNHANITAFSIVNQTAVHYLKLIGPSIGSLINSIIEMEKTARKADIETKFMAQPAIIFDAINMLAKGLVRLARTRHLNVTPLSCLRNETWNHGPSLINAMTAVKDYYGTTGLILFNKKSQRKEFNVSIMELTENGFHERSHWIGDRIVILPSYKKDVKINNPLRVTTKIEPPFVYYGNPDVNDNFDPNPKAWRGFCIDLLERIGSDLGLDFSIHVVADNLYGRPSKDETNPDGTQKGTGMIGELMSNKADLIVAPMTITDEREKVVDFTTPFMSLGLSILFLKPQTESLGLFSFLSPLSPSVWVYIITAFVGVSVVLFIISCITPDEWLHSHSWFAVGALMRQGCGVAPQATSSRIITGTWWFFTIIIISTYTAKLTAAFLTVDRLTVPIRGVEDLAQQTTIKYGTLKGGSSYSFFEKSRIPTYKKMFKYMQQNPRVLQDRIQAGIDRVLNGGGKYAFLMESSMIDFYVERNCNLMKVGDLLDSKGYGFGFQQGNPLQKRVSESILKLQKEHVLNNLKTKWWNEFNISESCSDKKQLKIPYSIPFYQVGGVFLFLGTGFLIAGLIAVVELYIRFSQKRSQFRGHLEPTVNPQLLIPVDKTSKSSIDPINAQICTNLDNEDVL